MIMEELVEKLNKASEDYYNGKESMSNKEFDDLFDQLKRMEAEEGRVLPNSPTQNVGAKAVDSLEKFKHPYPALSLDKTKDINEFVQKFRKGIKDSGNDNDSVVVMYKEDGSTVQAYYVDGKLDKLVTRGNGEIGSVITHNADCLSGLPKKLPHIIDLVVRGEAVMSYDEFNRINETLPEDQQYANPRNLAAATLTMLDPQEACKRHLKFQAFNLVALDAHPEYAFPSTQHFYEFLDNDNAVSTFSEKLRFLQDMNFNVVPHGKCPVDALSRLVEEMTENVKSYEYPVDGLVAAMDNAVYAQTLQGTEHHPHIMNGYAFKWADETKETVLREIEWSPSRTGLLNPVAIFDPVELEGTTVKRASLHNFSIMKEMNIKIGDRIEVMKANMIIPQIYQNLDEGKDPLVYLDNEWVSKLIGCCPTCGAQAEIHKSPEGIETVHCPNEDCPEKLIGKLAHFCSRDCMDIEGMSEETIKKLYDHRFIKEYADFFYLKDQPMIAMLPGFGKQSWKKMCDAAEKARNTDFVSFVTAMSIPNIGKGQAKTLLKYIKENYERLCEFANYVDSDFWPFELIAHLCSVPFDFSQIEGFGDKISESLTDWFSEHFPVDISVDWTGTPETRVYKELNFTDELTLVPANTNSAVSGKSFCITGKLMHFKNRDELVALIEKEGGKFVSSVSSKTDYLINNDTTSTSGKNKKAKEIGIPIISEADFIDLIN